MAKIQGEGDYESARHYDEATRKFVKDKGDEATRAPGGGVDEEALRKARSKARDGGQDVRDAELMEKEEERRGSGTPHKPG